MSRREAEVRLVTGSASRALYSVLQQVGAQHPEVNLELGSPERFKRRFGSSLTEFEAKRWASEDRLQIAAMAVESAQAQFALEGATLAQALQQPAAPLALEMREGDEQPPLSARIQYGNTHYERSDWGELAEKLFTHGLVCPAARAALHRRARSSNARDLQGQRFVLLGAGAELAPTRLLLEAGAELLWIDLEPPPPELRARAKARLWWCRDGADLLREPARVRETIETFANGRACHLGLYAYAPGGAREWRLTAAMNAIVEALAPEHVASVSLLLSPASPTKISEVDFERSKLRFERDPWWIRRCPWRRPAHRGSGPHRVFEGVVPLQGASYQAAQYVGKRLAAERLRRLRPQWRISANVAGISRTRSLEHPVFGLAFDGAHRLGVEIFDPQFTRSINGLLTLEDLFGDAPTPRSAEGPAGVGAASSAAEAQLHGGVMSLPVALQTAIGLAALQTSLRHPTRTLRAIAQR